MTSYPALAALDLVTSDESRFTATSVPSAERSVVFGGQLIGQVVRAAAGITPAMRVRSVHTLFARAGDVGRPLDISVTALHRGRTTGAAQVTVRQGERTVCAGLVLLDSEEEDVFRAAPVMPEVAQPDELGTWPAWETPGAHVRPVDDVDLDSTDVTGPAELRVWVRWDDPGSGEQAVHQGLVAWFTDPFLIAAALRPHPGVGLAMAHDALSTGVLTHTLSFHEPLDATAWHLVTQVSVHSGGGRTFGEGRVFSIDGHHVASFVQDGMIRRFPQGFSAARSTSM